MDDQQETATTERFVSPLSVLGSTGSIGTQTLDVARKNSERFPIVALAARKSSETLISQVLEFTPKYVAVENAAEADSLRSALFGRIQEPPDIGYGAEAVLEAATYDGVTTAVVAISGFAGLPPLCAAIERGIHIALANKESLVAGGHLIRNALKGSRSVIVPVDSEHSSIFQCMKRRGLPLRPKRVTLTASGGPFLKTPLEEFSAITVERAVCHPRWKMGAKISVDSATLMNKGLEVIEAAELFSLDPGQIQVLIHPQSIVHGFVDYDEGTTIAALYPPDMKTPIAYALGYLCSPLPGTTPGNTPVIHGAGELDLLTEPLSFFQPEQERFPALGVCYQALRMGRAACIALNAANEVAVAEFIAGRIRFTDIYRAVLKSLESPVLSGISVGDLGEISQVMYLDTRIRAETVRVTSSFQS